MVLVDTSVWIDFLRGKQSPEVQIIVLLLENEEELAFTGIILQELLQGCRDQKSADAIEKHFEPLIEIFPQRITYRSAAHIFRMCRLEGYTIRSSIDCLIAACALEYGCSVLHKDRDFRVMEQVCGLKILRSS